MIFKWKYVIHIYLQASSNSRDIHKYSALAYYKKPVDIPILLSLYLKKLIFLTQNLEIVLLGLLDSLRD